MKSRIVQLAIREVYVCRRCFWNKLNSPMKLNLTLSQVGDTSQGKPASCGMGCRRS